MARQKTPRQKKRPSPMDWELTDELIPRPGLPSVDKMIRRQRWTRRYVASSAYLLPLVLFISFVSIANSRPAQTSSGSSSVSSPGRVAATLEMTQWLAEKPSPLPGADIMQWDGATSYPASGKGSWPMELDTFTLRVGRGASPRLYTATVEVALQSNGATALGGPSIAPDVTNASVGATFTDGPWPGLVAQNQVSSAVQAAINSWLTAYTSGSASQLRLVVGDSSNDGAYVPLSGVTSASAAVTYAAPTTTSGSSEIVEVNLSLRWSGESGAASGPIPTTLDLLVSRANTAAPVVVAWGPAGTGPSLVPYQNAGGAH